MVAVELMQSNLGQGTDHIWAFLGVKMKYKLKLERRVLGLYKVREQVGQRVSGRKE